MIDASSEPRNDVETALDIGLEAAVRVLKDRLGTVDVDVVIVARVTGPGLKPEHNRGRDSCLAASLGSAGNADVLIRELLERALREATA